LSSTLSYHFGRVISEIEVFGNQKKKRKERSKNGECRSPLRREENWFEVSEGIERRKEVKVWKG